jgi:RNA 2',3'-cyclic 3'-phosphodiesterase
MAQANPCMNGDRIQAGQVSGKAVDDRLRLFVALPLGNEWLEPLARFQARLACLPGGGTVRWTRPDQVHLTLRFLGAVSASEVPDLSARIKSACHGFQAFDLELDRLGAFPGSRRPRVLWLGLRGAVDRLIELHDSVDRALTDVGEPREFKPFRPHLTIGRVQASPRDGQAVGGIVEAAPTPGSGRWHVEEVVLMRSDLLAGGARYTRLLTVGLSGV